MWGWPLLLNISTIRCGSPTKWRYLRLPNLRHHPRLCEQRSARSLSSQPDSPWLAGSQPLERLCCPGWICARPRSIFHYHRSLPHVGLPFWRRRPKPLPKHSCLLRAGYTGKARRLQRSILLLSWPDGSASLAGRCRFACSACHTVLGIENRAGLAEVLVGRWEPSDVIRPTVSEQLFVLSSGSVPTIRQTRRWAPSRCAPSWSRSRSSTTISSTPHR